MEFVAAPHERWAKLAKRLLPTALRLKPSASPYPSPTPSPSPSPVPAKIPCPNPTYTADGNLIPTVCRIPNPLAVSFYTRLMPDLFRLGSNASPDDVLQAICREGVTNSEVEHAVALATAIHHWTFGVQPVDEFESGACP